jgi:hypothetical protein
MAIKNNAELLKAFSGIIREIVKKVILDMLYKLQDDIDEYTYGQLPNIDYYNGSGYPTYQFKDAFIFNDVEQKLNNFVSELYYNWQSMDYDANTYLHGNPYDGDLRQQLADILNTDSDINKPRKPYWDIFITDMFDKGGIEKLFDKYTKSEFGNLGILVTKG